MDATKTISNFLEIPDTSGVYRLVSGSGAFYIGAAKSLFRRAREHTAKLEMGSGQDVLKQALRLSPNGLHMEVIELCDVSKLNERELYWIQRLNPTLNKYKKMGWGKSTGARICGL